jgi:hypothetical protein
MLIKGHTEVLKKAVQDTEEVERFFAREPKGSHLSYEMLEIGVKYQDMPCATRVLDYVQEKDRRNVRVYMKDYKLCNPLSLLVHAGPYPMSRSSAELAHLSEAYISHNLTLAYLHSMTPTPDMTNAQVAREVLRLCASLAAMAINDSLSMDGAKNAPNAFWMGVLLHLVTDAFSPAHVLRHAHHSSRKSDAILAVLRTLHAMEVREGYRPKDLSVDLVVRTVEEVASEILDRVEAGGRGVPASRSDVLGLLRSRHASKGLPVGSFPSTPGQLSALMDMFMAIYMYQRMKRKAGALLDDPKLARTIGNKDKDKNNNKNNNKNKEKDNISTFLHMVNKKGSFKDRTTWDEKQRKRMGIVCFLYYNNQSHASHFFRDTSLYIKYSSKYKKVRYYEGVVSVCSALLDRYVQAVQELRGKNGKDGASEVEQRFVDDVLTYLESEVFFFHAPDCGDLHSGYDIDLIEREFVKHSPGDY